MDTTSAVKCRATYPGFLAAIVAAACGPVEADADHVSAVSSAERILLRSCLASYTVTPAPPESKFAITVNGEGGRLACDNPAASCFNARRYFERQPPPSGPDRKFIFLELGPPAAPTYRGHRDPANILDNWGAPTCWQGKCARESDGTSLLFEGYAVTGYPDFADRNELQLTGSDDPAAQAFQFGEWRYLRFFIKLSPSFQAAPDLGSSVLIHQVWQRDSQERTCLAPEGIRVRPSVGPAFSIALTAAAPPGGAPPPEGLVSAQFIYRNDSINEAAAQRTSPPGPDRKVFASHLIKKNLWTGFLIAMKPVYEPRAGTADPTAPGAILIWSLGTRMGLQQGATLDQTKAINWDPNDASKSLFFWGYRPERAIGPPDGAGGFMNGFDVRVGLYRSSKYYQPFWLDHVKLSNDESCIPGTAPTCP